MRCSKRGLCLCLRGLCLLSAWLWLSCGRVHVPTSVRPGSYSGAPLRLFDRNPHPCRRLSLGLKPCAAIPIKLATFTQSDDKVSNLPKSDFSVFPLINLVCLFLGRCTLSGGLPRNFGNSETTIDCNGTSVNACAIRGGSRPPFKEIT